MRNLPVSGGDSEEEGVVLLQYRRIAESLDVGWLWWSVHLGENLLGESLLDLVEVARATGLLDTSGLSLSQLLYVAVHGVLDKLSA